MTSSASFAVYENHFGEGVGFLLKEAPLSSIGGVFNGYDQMLASSSSWYSLANMPLRREFDIAFSSSPPSFERHIDKLSQLEKEKLFSVVTILCHLYRWGSVPAPESEYKRRCISLPRGLEYPLLYLAAQFNRPPCGSLWSTTVSNYRTSLSAPGQTVDSRRLTIENTSLLHSWFEGYEKEQLEAWVKVFVLFEAEGAHLIPAAITTIEGAYAKSPSLVLEGLLSIEASIKRLTSLFAQLTRQRVLDKNLWREKIQPTFIWGIERDNTILEGASGLQLGVTQAADILLGVKFGSKMGKALINSRQYMPIQHRMLLEAFETDAKVIAQYIESSGSSDITQQFNACLELLSRLRVAHMQVGKQFIEGNGEPKKITTTGLSMNLEGSPIPEFEADMKERILETRQAFTADPILP